MSPTAAPGTSPIAANQGFNVGPDLVTQEFGWRQGVAFLTGVVYSDTDNNNFYTPGEGLGGVTIQAVGTAGQGTFQATTWDSGGYSLQLPPGTYDVTATGNLPFPQSTVVTIGQDNVGWDIQLKPQAAADQPVPGDYNGDGTTDLAVYRSSSAQWFIAGQPQPISFGWAGVDIPMPGDYDGDRPAPRSPSTARPPAQWFIAGHAAADHLRLGRGRHPRPRRLRRRPATPRSPSTGRRPAQWFIAGHAQPIQLRLAGRRHPRAGRLRRHRPHRDRRLSPDHRRSGSSPATRSRSSFGWAGVDIPVPGDYDGTGHTEIAVYRPTTAQWFVAGLPQPIAFGWAGVDTPVAGDFDGDGKADIAVYPPGHGPVVPRRLDRGGPGLRVRPGGSGPARLVLAGRRGADARAPVIQFALGTGTPAAASGPPRQSLSPSATASDDETTAPPDRTLAATVVRRKPASHRAARKAHRRDGGWRIGVRGWIKGAWA